MEDTNRVVIVGTVGREAETQPDGSALLSVSTVRRATRDGDEMETHWHRVRAEGDWASLAIDCLHIGQRVRVVGELRYGSTEVGRVVVPNAHVVASDIEML